MDAALAEFELTADGRLNHPRVQVEIEKLDAARKRQSAGGRAKALKTQPEATADDDPGF
jgi:hypothetical protein